MIFFSIGPRVLMGLCFFNRMETSAPGLSGHYWYGKITVTMHHQKLYIGDHQYMRFCELQPSLVLEISDQIKEATRSTSM